MVPRIGHGRYFSVLKTDCYIFQQYCEERSNESHHVGHDATAEDGHEHRHRQRREGDAKGAAGHWPLVEESTQPDKVRVHRERGGVDVKVSRVYLDRSRQNPPDVGKFNGFSS